MAFSPAWGGLIPLVPIGSFREFLTQRQKGKSLKVWYTGAVTGAVVKTALRTKVGKQFVSALQVHIFARLGFKPSPSVIGVELQAYIAFRKFAHQTAARNNQAARQRDIERIMRPGRLTQRGGGNAAALRSPFPLGYFETLTRTIPSPRPHPTGRSRRDTDNDDTESFASWFERRKRRKGRLVNV